jgi:regulator of sirC expression with transglutaminase-like and TPR domain
MDRSPVATRFAAALHAEDGIDLLRAAMSVGMVGDPALDVDHELATFEGLAATIRLEVADAGSGSALDGLNRALFVTHGFQGDSDDYYDPRNCFLHEVLRRRRGMPIALSIIYVAIGRGLGLELEGIGFPAHFIVRAGHDPAAYRYIDPFNRGQELTPSDLRGFLSRNGMDAERLELYLAAVTPRQILARLLMNLKRIYVERRDFDPARAVVDLLVVLTPWDLAEIRSRGLLSEALGDRETAIADLSVYVEHAADAADAAQMRERLRRLQGTA